MYFIKISLVSSINWAGVWGRGRGEKKKKKKQNKTKLFSISDTYNDHRNEMLNTNLQW